ncbi:MAG: hypothetical protein KDD70_17365 [Bdellovibrionales bacterium]|nr:hypothetical protein [Bdellovibrionales bacterium]
MYSSHGFTPQPAESHGQGQDESSEVSRASQIVNLRRSDIPELIQHLKGFHSLQRVEGPGEEDSIAHSEDAFIDRALGMRDLITDFIHRQVSKPEAIGFRAEQVERCSISDETALLSALSELESFIELRLITPLENPFLQEVVPHIHEQLGEVMEVVRESFPGGVLRPDMSGRLAYNLLDLRAVLTSAALESQARRLSEALQGELQVDEVSPTGGARLLTINDGSVLTKEVLRQDELRLTVLPEIQRTVGRVVNGLILFLSQLRNHEPAPIGFSLTRVGSEVPVSSTQILKVLEQGSEQLEEKFASLDDDTSMDVNYRAYIHGIDHHLLALRVALLTESPSDQLSERSLPQVQKQCELVFRKITSGIGQLTEVASANLALFIQEEDEGDDGLGGEGEAA